MVAKKITSLQHPLVKHWFELRTNKTYREQAQRLLIAGKKMVAELPIEVLITVEPSSIACREQVIVPKEILKKITGLQAPDGFAAEIALPQPQDLKGKQWVLILDQIADPGNLGTLLRTALALGWEGVILTPGTVDPFNDKALRAGKGAQFHLPFAYMDMRDIEEMRLHLYAADLDGGPLGHVETPLGLILSSEGHGARIWKTAKKITLPMRSEVESLNVAATGAILLYVMRNPHDA
ncbi:MAG: RNA methyltransferase [Verrucomicrobia bacterium]|nr:RNA methyltransferase [Verrucomicrobiota bacterium]MDE3048140.1 RNA methyltransferase [Verrucomicrobiota bacterium]